MNAMVAERSPPHRISRRAHDRILGTSGVGDLSPVLAPDVLAVIAAAKPEPWIETLATAVGHGGFVVPRSILDGVSLSEIARFLSGVLNAGALPAEARSALRDDLLRLVAACGDLTFATRFRFRFFTDIPNTRCSYHVDVVPPGSPTTALIRVYCGAQTEYVDPDNVTSWEDFHAWEFLRKRQVLAAAAARGRQDPTAEVRAMSRLTRLDAKPHFMVTADDVRTVPAHALVACKFVDSQHLLDCTHLRARSARGWIHRSPMSGVPRCVATVSAID
jgi:hypothetical protein